MVVRLPKDAWVKTSYGDKLVGDLTADDEVVVFDVPNRQLGFTKVSIAEIHDHKRLTFHITHFRWVSLLTCTQCYNNGGPIPADRCPDFFICYCIINPSKLVPKRVEDIAEYGDVPSRELTWEGDGYLWSEGILVGSRP